MSSNAINNNKCCTCTCDWMSSSCCCLSPHTWEPYGLLFWHDTSLRFLRYKRQNQQTYSLCHDASLVCDYPIYLCISLPSPPRTHGSPLPPVRVGPILRGGVSFHSDPTNLLVISIITASDYYGLQNFTASSTEMSIQSTARTTHRPFVSLRAEWRANYFFLGLFPWKSPTTNTFTRST